MSFSGHTEEGIINVDQDVTSQLTSSKPSSLTIDLDVDAIKIEDNVFLDPQNVNDDENHFSIQGNVHVENNLWVGNLHDFSASVNQRGGINFIYEPYSHRHQQGMFIHQQSKKTSVLVFVVALLLNLPFLLLPVLLIRKDETILLSCRPWKGWFLLLAVIGGLVNLLLVLFYLALVYRHRRSALILSRGKSFLPNYFAWASLTIIFFIFTTVSYFGYLDGVCHLTHMDVTESPVSVYFLFKCSKLFLSLFIGSIVARLRILNLIFTNRKSVYYSPKKLNFIFYSTLVVFFILFFLLEIPYFIYRIVLSSQIVLPTQSKKLFSLMGNFNSVFQVAVLSYYTYKVRKVELLFSDWYANLRVLIWHITLTLITTATLFFVGPSISVFLGIVQCYTFLMTYYVMDNFTALLVCAEREKRAKQRSNREELKIPNINHQTIGSTDSSNSSDKKKAMNENFD